MYEETYAFFKLYYLNKDKKTLLLNYNNKNNEKKSHKQS